MQTFQTLVRRRRTTMKRLRGFIVLLCLAPIVLSAKLPCTGTSNPIVQDYFTELDLSKDLSKLLWYKGAGEEADVSREEHMIEVDVKLDADTDKLVVGSSNLPLTKYMEYFALPNTKKGLQLNFDDQAAFDAYIASSKVDVEPDISINPFPIWIKVDVVKGPGSSKEPLTLPENNDLPCYTLLLGWTKFSNKLQEKDITSLKAVGDKYRTVYSILASTLVDQEKLIYPKLENDEIKVSFEASDEDKINMKNFKKLVDTTKTKWFINKPSEIQERENMCLDTNTDFMAYFGLDADMTQLTWTDFVNKKTYEVAFNGEKHMLKGEVTLKDTKLYVGGDLELSTLLKMFKAPQENKKKGLFLNFDSDDTLIAALKVIGVTNNLKNIPIWINANVLKIAGPTNTQNVLTLTKVANSVMPCYTSSFSWIYDNSLKLQDTDLTTMQNKFDHLHKIYQVPAALVDVWADITKLLPDTKPEDKLTISNKNEDIKNVNLLDFIKMKTDMTAAEKIRVSFDISTRLGNLLTMCPKHNQDVNEYFMLNDDLTTLTWSKSIIDGTELEAALADPEILMVKADVYTKEVESVKTAFIGDENSKYRLEDLLAGFKQVRGKKGLKLSIKDNDVFAAIAAKLDSATFTELEEFPIWIHADVVGEDKGKIDLNYDNNNNIFNCYTLSLGWTKSDYAETDFEAMQDVAPDQNLKTYLVPSSRLVETITWNDKLTGKKYPLTVLGSINDTGIIKDIEKYYVNKEGKWEIFWDIPEVLHDQLRPCQQPKATYFDIEDLSLLKWAQKVKLGDIANTVKSVDIIGVEVTFTESTLKIAGGTPTEFWEAVKVEETSERFGIKFEIASTDALSELHKEEKLMKLKRPIWIHADLVQVNDASPPEVKIDKDTYNELLKCRHLSIGLFGDTNVTKIDDKLKKEMEDTRKTYTTDTVTYSVRAGLFSGTNVEHLSKLLAGESNTDTITLITKEDGDTDSIKYLKIRPLLREVPVKGRFYIDLSKSIQESLVGFPKLANFFNDGKPSEVTWLQSVNTKADLDKALEGTKNMIGADVYLSLDGTTVIVSNKPPKAEEVPPKKDEDLPYPLLEFLQNVGEKEKNIGIKLNFTSTGAYTTAIKNKKILDLLVDLAVPVVINANVAKATDAGELTIVELKGTDELLFKRDFSLGWTMGIEGKPYIKQNTDDMKDKATSIKTSSKIYSIRALLLPDSWDVLKKNLLDGNDGDMLSIWSPPGEDGTIDALKLKILFANNPKLLYLDLTDDTRSRIAKASGRAILPFSFALTALLAAIPLLLH